MELTAPHHGWTIRGAALDAFIVVSIVKKYTRSTVNYMLLVIQVHGELHALRITPPGQLKRGQVRLQFVIL